jgi:hypothetical protein
MERTRWEGPEALAPGKHTLVFDFKYDGPGFGKGGTGELTVDGKEAGSKKIPHTIPFILTIDETFDVGIDTRSPVDDKVSSSWSTRVSAGSLRSRVSRIGVRHFRTVGATNAMEVEAKRGGCLHRPRFASAPKVRILWSFHGPSRKAPPGQRARTRGEEERARRVRTTTRT